MKEAYSTHRDVANAVAEVKSKLDGFSAKAVLFFASSCYEANALAQAMSAAFPGAEVFGCTTAGEIVTGKMLDNSLVAMAFNSTEFPRLHVEVVESVSEDTVGKIDQAMCNAGRHLGAPVMELHPNQYAGLVLMDGLTGAEEKVVERLGDLCELTFVGGSAGDDLKFSRTHIFAKGKAFSDAALLVTFEVGMPFDVVKTQSFRPLGKTLVASEVAHSGRKVVSFNGKPAVEEYAEAVGLSVEELPKAFLDHPVGLMIGDEPFVRSPQKVEKDGLAFYCHIHEGMELELLEGTDIVADTHRALQLQVGDPNNIAGVLNFNCILRTLELKELGETEAYANLFSDFPTVGFSSYGEAFLGHINQTATMLVFKKAA